MSGEITFQTVAIVATFLCSLIAGFLFAFATIVMPGIAKLNDREFIRAFQAIDGVIQNNQPLFVAVWLGSILAAIASAGLGFDRLTGTPRLLSMAAPAIYLFGVQLSTFTINVPLNNALQKLNVDVMDTTSLKAARRGFEPSWNRWNWVRTPFAGFASVLFAVLLFQL
ncbi:MAG: DUF1772 domain-containing protein [Geitlerinemataceae cyanobacterium]